MFVLDVKVFYKEEYNIDRYSAILYNHIYEYNDLHFHI